MKKLLIGLAVVAVILAVVLGIQVGQTNKLKADLEDQKANVAALIPVKDELEEVKKQTTALTAEKEEITAELQAAQKNQAELTAQIETLNDPKVLADRGQLEKDYANLISQYDELTQKNQEFEKQQVLLKTLAEEESKLRSEAEAQLKISNDQIDSFVDTIKATEEAKDEAVKAAEATKADALKEAEEIKTKALNEAEQIKQDAEKAVQTAKTEALEQVETVKAQALQDVENARAEAATALSADQTEVTKMLNDKIDANTKVSDEKIAELQVLIDQANQKATELDAKLQAEIDEKTAIKADAEKQVQAAQAETADALKQVEEVRTQAAQEIAKAQEESAKAIETAKTDAQTAIENAKAESKAAVDELNAKLQAEEEAKNAALSDLDTMRVAAQKAEDNLAAVAAKADAASIALVPTVETAVEAKAEETAAATVVETADVSPEVPAGQKTKASIWHTFTKGQEEYLKKAVSDFNASQESYEIDLLSQPYENFLGSVRSAVVEGIGPDVIFNYASEAASYVKAGLVADLGQYIYDDEIGIEDFEGSLVDGVMNGEVKAFEDGVIHYLPAYTTGPIFFYNKTLFEELNLNVPATWEEMEELAKTVYEAKGIAALGFDSLTDLVQMFIMETPGAGYIDVDNKQVLFDTPEVRAKIEWMIDMVKKGYFLIKPTGNYFSEDFNSGIVAGYIGSSAGYPYIKPADGKFEFAMAPVPAQTWFPSWNRGPIVFYYKDDARAQAAYEFVKYFISPDVNAGWTEAVVALTPYSWTKDNEEYKAFINQDTLAAQALKAVEANLDIAGSLPAVDGANVVRDALKAAIEKAALGDMTVDEAWTEAVTVSNAALKGE